MKKLNYFLAFSFVFSFSYFLITKDYKHPSRSIAQAGSPDGDYEITGRSSDKGDYTGRSADLIMVSRKDWTLSGIKTRTA